MVEQVLGAERCDRLFTDKEEQVHVWTNAIRQSRFPNYRIRKGIKYNGVYEVIYKPHGLTELMIRALKNINDNKIYRWGALINKLEKTESLNKAKEAIELMVNSGILIIKEKNTRPAKGYYWIPICIMLDDRASDDVVKLQRKKENQLEWQNQLIQEVKGIHSGCRSPRSPMEKKLEKLIEMAVELLKNPYNCNEFAVIPRSKIKFRSILLMLVYGRLLLSTDKTMPLRTMSCLIWDNSKILDRYTKKVAELIGESIKSLGITTHPIALWIYGNATYQLEGEKLVHLTAGRPSIIAEDTVMSAEICPGEDLKFIIIVENLTVFMTLLNRTYYGRRDVIILWSDGYWNHVHKKLLAGLLKKKSITTYVWSDLDGDGMEIARLINQWLVEQGYWAKIVLMGKKELEMVQSNRTATERDISLMSKAELISLFPEAINIIYKSKRTLEQESILNYYDYVLSQLP